MFFLLIVNTLAQDTVYFQYVNDTLSNASCSSISNCYNLMCRSLNHKDGFIKSVYYVFQQPCNVIKEIYKDFIDKIVIC